MQQTAKRNPDPIKPPSLHKRRTVLVILCGLPGAGKSTLAGALVRHVSIASANVGTTFAENRMNAEDEIRKALAYGGLVVCDDNQFYKSMRKSLIRMAHNVLAAALLVYVRVPVEMAVARDAQRPLSSRVGEEVIRRMHERFDHPKADNEEVITVRGDESTSENTLHVYLKTLRIQMPVLRNTALPSISQLSDDKAEAELQRRKAVRVIVLEAKSRGLSGSELSALAKQLRT